MLFRELLSRWNLKSLKITTPFLEASWSPNDADRTAAWDMYIELITRVTTQQLLPEQGDEARALQSIYELFPLTRATIKNGGRDCRNFTRIAVVVLNQIVRPFTSKWHREFVQGTPDETKLQEFRSELADLQADLKNYSRLLAELAEVEDLTDLESV